MQDTPSRTPTACSPYATRPITRPPAGLGMQALQVSGRKTTPPPPLAARGSGEHPLDAPMGTCACCVSGTQGSCTKALCPVGGGGGVTGRLCMRTPGQLPHMRLNNACMRTPSRPTIAWSPSPVMAALQGRPQVWRQVGCRHQVQRQTGATLRRMFWAFRTRMSHLAAYRWRVFAGWGLPRASAYHNCCLLATAAGRCTLASSQTLWRQPRPMTASSLSYAV